MILFGQKKLKKVICVLIIAVLLTAISYIFGNASKFMFPLKYKEFVSIYSEKFSVDPFLVLAIIKVESNFDPSAVSPKNARGLMQISAKTGQWGAQVLKLNNYGNNSLFDPETSILIGCWYLNVLNEEFNGNTDLVLAAYNGGSGNVNEWLKNKSYSNSGISLEKVPFKETESYIKKVKNCRLMYKKLYENIF